MPPYLLLCYTNKNLYNIFFVVRFSYFLFSLFSLVVYLEDQTLMITGKKTANAVGGKTARACDSCVRKRAKWYCAADDAFLCQSCDGSVHSANQLAGRHERVLFETASSKQSRGLVPDIGSPEPAWHQGLTRRARTPRNRSKYSLKLERKTDIVNSSAPLVPEIGALEPSLVDDDDEDDDEEEQLLYRVPVFDPFETELYNASDEIGGSLSFMVEDKQEDACNLDDLQGFDILPTDDMELLEFAADVESLLGKGYDDSSCRIEELGLTNYDFKDEEDNTNIFEENRVKVEDDDPSEAILGFDLDATRETLDWDFGHESTMMIKEEEKKEHMMMMVSSDECKEGIMERKSSINLRLNFDEVINAWGDQSSPWTNGIRPELNLDGCWPDFMGLQWKGNNNPSCGGDGGREARVSRYREKRRTRLFSKKIRYEVRKLNAEKRPRMKGRFVKREGNL